MRGIEGGQEGVKGARVCENFIKKGQYNITVFIIIDTQKTSCHYFIFCYIKLRLFFFFNEGFTLVEGLVGLVGVAGCSSDATHVLSISLNHDVSFHTPIHSCVREA